jgi:hypothetical protein
MTLARENYKTDEYRRFQESLVYICEYENRVYHEMEPDK